MRSVNARLRRLEAAMPATDVADLTDAELAWELERVIMEVLQDGKADLDRWLAEMHDSEATSNVLARIERAAQRRIGWQLICPRQV